VCVCIYTHTHVYINKVVLQRGGVEVGKKKKNEFQSEPSL